MDRDLEQRQEKTEKLGERSGLLCFPADFFPANLWTYIASYCV